VPPADVYSQKVLCFFLSRKFLTGPRPTPLNETVGIAVSRAYDPPVGKEVVPSMVLMSP